jgi:hypothetical protein
MTTFAYRLRLNDTEAISLEAALEHYIKYCSDKNESPYVAHKNAAENILSRLFDNMQMTSTSSFCQPQ